jgi:hypothetical protein
MQHYCIRSIFLYDLDKQVEKGYREPRGGDHNEHEDNHE